MDQDRKRRTAAILAATCCLALAACSQNPSGGTRGPLPGLEKFYAQKLAWGPCAPFATTAEQREPLAKPGLECAKLAVPLDYTAPAGRTAQIAVLRKKAAKQEAKIGSLLVNPGGPGGSGLMLGVNLSDLADYVPFDVVAFDPRGVGASTPAIDCVTDQERDADRAEPFRGPDEVAAADADNKTYAEQCVVRSGGADVVANAGTRDVARDMDVLRAALGDQKLTYLGYSYGTRIGASYAEQFPQNVRAMLLDGAVHPSADPAKDDIAQWAAFQKAFDAYAVDCVKTPTCPLGTNPAEATAAFQALTRPLVATPAPAGARKLTYGDAMVGTIAPLYQSAQWPELTTALTALKAGDGAALMGLADRYLHRGADGAYTNGSEAQFVVNCLDGVNLTDRAVAADVERQIKQVAPFIDPGVEEAVALPRCASLPAKPTGGPHTLQADGLPPVMVIATTGDPATPYEGGVEMAKQLKAVLVTVEGNQHAAFLTTDNECITKIGAEYLITLKLPAEGARCKL